MSTWSGPPSWSRPSPAPPPTGCSRWWSGRPPSGTLRCGKRNAEQDPTNGRGIIMKKIILGLAAIAALGFGPAQAADPFTIQLKWVTQAQFGGYYVAAEKGFYADEG